MRMTQKDIARELGISLITVSRALNNSGYVSEKLRRRILEFADRNGYVPHKASQVLVRNKIRRITLFSSTLPVYFWKDIRRGIDIAADHLRPFNYEVRYHTIAESDSEGFLKVLNREIESGVDALGFVNQRMYDMKSIFGIADREGIPYITYNVDAHETSRRCYIGSDYQAGGKLAAEFIGKTLQFKNNAVALVITTEEPVGRYPFGPDINGKRLQGFLSVMQEHFQNIKCQVEVISTKLKKNHIDHEIEDLLRNRKGHVDAVYLIPAFNSTFLQALEKLDYRKVITLLHDIDSTAIHHLETHRLSGVVYQNPVLQGYYAVKTLELILESKEKSELQDIVIDSNLVLAENRSLLNNQYALLR